MNATDVNAADADDNAAEQPQPQSEMETAQEHSGSDTVSHGMNSNLTPDGAATPADQRAAENIQEQHAHGAERASTDTEATD
ncbi:hypothetical protein [Deinococcus sp.]|uniref:hypothetical protein n=1 Tax=Deinococcus sp. TaxID=47478 RepID=UPI003CC6D71E